MRKVYNQKNMSLTIDGVNIQDFHEGATFVYTWDGGEVDKTQGTDGAGINIATNQGATLQFTLRETSRSIKFLSDLRLRQENGGAGVTVVARTGADILLTMTEGYISRPALHGRQETGFHAVHHHVRRGRNRKPFFLPFLAVLTHYHR